ncbi:MAG: carbohydrate ABC transporter permease [Oscillospiraceae bacterium]
MSEKEIKTVSEEASAAANAEPVYAKRATPKKPAKMKKSRISYERKKGLYGYGFIALWFIGAVYFFIIPVIMSIYYSFNDVTLQAPDLVAKWCGIENYKNAFVDSATYVPKLLSSLQDVALKVPIIVIFSLFAAVLLNQKFKGRTVVRAIFFLPVLIATGPVMSVINGDMLNQGVSGASQFSSLFKTDLVTEFLQFMGIYNLSETLTTFITTITSDVFNLIWNSGVQILIFLAALQTIPTSAREAANMEGATAWEFFWKITFPYVSPMILANIIYTVIDCFTDASNPVMQLVTQKSNSWDFGYSAAMAWIYFGIIAICLVIISVVITKLVHYEVD